MCNCAKNLPLVNVAYPKTYDMLCYVMAFQSWMFMHVIDVDVDVDADV